MRLHYFFVKDFDTIRTWANNVEVSYGELLYFNGNDIPEPTRPFHPENVSIIEEEGVRKLVLSWNSGLMSVNWNLIIYPPDEIYQSENGILAKIQPGVYLHFYTY